MSYCGERDQAKKYMDVAGVMFVVLDKEARIIQMNRKGYEILGYNEGELFARDWFEVLVPEDVREKARTTFKEVVKGNVQPNEYLEYEVITRNGQRKIMAFHNAMLFNEQGKISGTLSSVEDITERIRAEEKNTKA